MKASRFFISTLKEAPSDAEVISHKLMMRAGMIKRLGAGIYSYMPIGLRVIRKVEAIIREEMDRAGAIELLMPVVQPAELWQETGRFEKMGPELMRVKDRHDRDFVIQPTSEEVITDIARQELRSYRALPKNFYHIQTKFRDERRPRFGVMRGREFTMKDAYSFDRDLEAAGRSYDAMYAAYERIFTRMGLRFRAVAADNGAIGGVRSHEFQVIADTGEDAIIYLSDVRLRRQHRDGRGGGAGRAACGAGAAAAEGIDPRQGHLRGRRRTCSACRCSTPSSRSCSQPIRKDDAGDVTSSTVWLLLVRGDHALNEVKVSKLPGLDQGFRFATGPEIDAHFGCKPGYLGPIGTRRPVQVVADRTVAAMSDFICGANEHDFHLTGVNWGRDLPEPDLVADMRDVVAGDPSPDGHGVLEIQRGIEVGHVFLLGSHYSRAMNASYLDEQGKPQLMEMGCYGIGVTRILGAAIEQNHDERGIVWPVALAPFSIVLCPIGYARSEAVRGAADTLYADLLDAGVDVLLDDRGERPGAMFADWELIGIPLRVVLSDRGLADGMVELQGRTDAAASTLALEGVAAAVAERLAA